MMKKCRKFRPTIQPIVSVDQQSKKHADSLLCSSLLVDKDFVSSMVPTVTTCVEGINHGMQLSANGDCLGYLNHVKRSYTWLTYSQCLEKMRHFGAGLVQLGCKASNYTKISIFSANRVEWTIAQYGCYHYSIVIVPLYDTLGAESRTFIVNQCESECIIVDTLERVRQILNQSEQMPSVRYVVSMENLLPDELVAKANQKGIGLYSYNQVEKIGRINPIEPVLPQSHSLAMIMYTSGTTGTPKGVMLTHGNFVASSSGLAMQMGSNVDIGSLTFLSFLPMAHSFEQCVQSTLLMLGARIGYYSGQLKNLQRDMRLLKPSALILVPRLLNRVYNAVLAEVRSSRLKTFLLRAALSSKQRQITNFVYHRNSIWDRLVFQRLRAKFGGNVKLLASGSAPLSPTILNFFRCALGCIVVEGYGQTESCGATCATFPGDYTTDHVGAPLICCQIKLEQVPEMEYDVNKDAVGEICIRGANVFIGYFQDPQSTTNALDQDGWLHTGDIGVWNENGTLRIVDRKKHIFKLSQGEYIAPEKVENVYLQSPFVAQCYVDGNSLESFIVAVIVPDVEHLNHWCNDHSISFTLQEACDNPSFKKTIFDDLISTGRREGLNSLEQVRDIYLHPEPFTIENGLLTPTMKTRRTQCREHFRQIIKDLYDRNRR